MDESASVGPHNLGEEEEEALSEAYPFEYQE